MIYKYIYWGKSNSQYYYPTISIWPKEMSYVKHASKLLVIFDEMV